VYGEAFVVPQHQKRLPIYHGLLFVSSPFRNDVSFPGTNIVKNHVEEESIFRGQRVFGAKKTAGPAAS